MLSALHKLFHLIPTTTTGALDYLSHRNVQFSSVQFSSVTQSCLTLCNLINAACQASLSITNSRSPHKPMAIESVMPSKHLILCCPLLLLPSIFLSIRDLVYFKRSETVSPSMVYDSLPPPDCSPPGSSIHGISQARILEWVAISFTRGSSPPRDQTLVFYIAGSFFTV